MLSSPSLIIHEWTSVHQFEKGRIIEWIFGKEEWVGLACIGAINTQFESEKGKTNEWHYYISSRNLTAEELLKHARLEWSVETMHWLLDVHFGEDFCRAAEQRTQENLNIIRKIVLNALRFYKTTHKSKSAFSHFMRVPYPACN